MSNIRLLASVFLMSLILPSVVLAGEDDSCQSMAQSIANSVRISTRGVEPSYSVYLRIKEYGYRITLAMKVPSSQSSPVFAQIIWDGLRSAEIESYIVERFRKAFGNARLEPMDRFLRVSTGPLDRDAFAAGVKAFEADLRSRSASPAKVHSFISPHARTASAEVREAARAMAGLLKRRKVSTHETDIDRILSRAHLHLIRALDERELRFFDYDIFDEVLSYEKDQSMQSIAEKARGQLPAADLDYMAIHEEIRQKLVRIARGLVQSLRQQEKPYLERVNEYVRNIGLAGLSIVDAKGKHPHMPFNEDAMMAFYGKFANRTLQYYDSPEVLEALRSLQVPNKFDEIQKLWQQNFKDGKPVSWQPADHLDQWFTKNEKWNSLYYNNSQLMELIRFLEKEETDKINNEAGHDSLDAGNLMYVRSSVVLPGNGGNEGANFLQYDTGIASSFTNRPHRLHAGRGQNKAGFDYTQRERD